MKINHNVIYINQVSIDTGLWHIKRHLIEKHGCQQADIDIAPLAWYIATGRAPIDLIRKILNAKPFMIARKLHMGGSYDEAIRRVKDYVKWDD